MREAWSGEGLTDVEQTSLMIRMEYEAFEDFWAPIDAGEGPLGKYVLSLEPTRRAALAAAVVGRTRGPRSFARSRGRAGGGFRPPDSCSGDPD
jgi:hypothetical protein